MGGIEGEGRAGDGGREIARGREGHGGGGGGEGVGRGAVIWVLVAGRVGGADGRLWTGESAGWRHEICGLGRGQAWERERERTYLVRVMVCGGRWGMVSAYSEVEGGLDTCLSTRDASGTDAGRNGYGGGLRVGGVGMVGGVRGG